MRLVSMRGKREKEKPKMKKRTMFTILSVVNLTWYTVAVLILNFFDHTVSPELTIGWFAAWTAELALLFGIKVKGNSSDESKG